MPFQLDEFIRLRPFAYHVTHRENVRLLKASRRIRTAESVIRESGAVHLLGLRREHDSAVQVAGGTVVLKDQRPLIAANLELPPEWSVADFVAYLNGFVYFCLAVTAHSSVLVNDSSRTMRLTVRVCFGASPRT